MSKHKQRSRLFMQNIDASWVKIGGELPSEVPKISRYFKVPKSIRIPNHEPWKIATTSKRFEVAFSGSMTRILFFWFLQVGYPTRWWQLKFFLFSPIFGKDFQFDEHIFPLGWFNHQLAKDLKILRDCSGEAPTYTTQLLQLQRRIHQRILVLHHHVAGRVLRKQDWFWVEREWFVVQCAHLCRFFPLTNFWWILTPWSFRASFQFSKLYSLPKTIEWQCKNHHEWRYVSY